MTTVLKSNLDKSINYITKSGDSFVESRFVQRNEDYIIVYLSSHNGCNQSCRFCHLTQTGQTEEVDVTLEGYLEQASQVLNNVVFDDKIKKVHFNFMARGEPLNNKWFVENSSLLFAELTKLVPDSVECKFLVSSIIPKSFKGDLAKVFEDKRSKLYYSMYSVDKAFRKRWLPKAMSTDKAFAKIKAMQDSLGNKIKIHFALIDGENDTYFDAFMLYDEVGSYGIDCDVNIIQYNTFSNKHGKQASDEKLSSFVTSLSKLLRYSNIKIIDKVGFDVKASWGMFVEGEK